MGKTYSIITLEWYQLHVYNLSEYPRLPVVWVIQPCSGLFPRGHSFPFSPLAATPMHFSSLRLRYLCKVFVITGEKGDT